MGAFDATTDLPCLLFVAMIIRGGGSRAAIFKFRFGVDETLVFGKGG